MAEKLVTIKLGDAWYFEGNFYREGAIAKVPADIVESLRGAKVKFEIVQEKESK